MFVIVVADLSVLEHALVLWFICQNVFGSYTVHRARFACFAFHFSSFLLFNALPCSFFTEVVCVHVMPFLRWIGFCTLMRLVFVRRAVVYSIVTNHIQCLKFILYSRDLPCRKINVNVSRSRRTKIVLSLCARAGPDNQETINMHMHII